MISFQASYRSVEKKDTKNLMYTEPSKKATESKNSSVIIDGEKIKTGDTFYLQNYKGKINKAEFKGVYETYTSCDEHGKKDFNLMYKCPNEPKMKELSNYYDGDTQLFTKNGLPKLALSRYGSYFCTFLVFKLHVGRDSNPDLLYKSLLSG